jgi:hypothetical protein
MFHVKHLAFAFTKKWDGMFHVKHPSILFPLFSIYVCGEHFPSCGDFSFFRIIDTRYSGFVAYIEILRAFFKAIFFIISIFFQGLPRLLRCLP